jgi:hypothetical protein
MNNETLFKVKQDAVRAALSDVGVTYQTDGNETATKQIEAAFRVVAEYAEKNGFTMRGRMMRGLVDAQQEMSDTDALHNAISAVEGYSAFGSNVKGRIIRALNRVLGRI